MLFFFLSQLATYYVILNALQQANHALDAMDAGDIAGAVAAFSAFRLSGSFGVLIELMRNLGTLVIPLYFVPTVSFVLNLNRAEIGRFTRRTAILSILLFFAELAIDSLLIGLITVLVAELFALVSAEIDRYFEPVLLDLDPFRRLAPKPARLLGKPLLRADGDVRSLVNALRRKFAHERRRALFSSDTFRARGSGPRDGRRICLR